MRGTACAITGAPDNTVSRYRAEYGVGLCMSVSILMAWFMLAEPLSAPRYASHGLQSGRNNSTLQAMTDNIRLPDELGRQLRARREALGLSKSALAEKAGKVREVVYRLEAGEDTTVSSLLAVMGALGLVLRLERAGLPSASEVAARFLEEDDDAS